MGGQKIMLYWLPRKRPWEKWFVGLTVEADQHSVGEGRWHRGRNRRQHTVYRRGRGFSIQGKVLGITSGSCRGQQGLVTTCKDSPNEAKCRRRREPNGSGA